MKLSIIKEVYNGLTELVTYDEFLRRLKVVDDEQKLIKYNKEEDEAKNIEVYDHFIIKDESTEDVGELLDNCVPDMDWFDTFYEEDGIDDDGEDIEEYMLVNDRLYLVQLHCTAEWVSDWSVRKNLPGDVTQHGFKEIEIDTISIDSDGDAKIKIK